MTIAGVLIDHPDKARLMQHIHQRPGINNATEMALSGYEGWIEAANKDGTDGIYSYKRLKATDWIVGARYPTAEAFAPMNIMRQRFKSRRAWRLRCAANECTSSSSSRRTGNRCTT